MNQNITEENKKLQNVISELQQKIKMLEKENKELRKIYLESEGH